jgi:hypothetical protein
MKLATEAVVVLLLIVATGVMADDKPKLPSVPPRLVIVGKLDRQNAQIELWSHTVRFVWESAAAKKQDETGEGTRIRKSVYETQAWTLALKSAEAFDAQGKKVNPDEVWRRIAVGSVVAIAADDRPVDALYLSALAKDMLVFVSPEYAVNNVMQVARGAPTLYPAGSPIVPAGR